MRPMKLVYFIPTLTILFVGGVLLPMRATLAADDQRCFPEAAPVIRDCIDARFRAYWEANGGLPVFGYPISSAQQEINRDTGASYLTQYFERQRLEYHPENARPYDVLTGRLGDDVLRRSGRDWRSFPTAAPTTAHYVPETGHAIGAAFFEYWGSHGLDLGDPGVSDRESLALFGHPLSEPMMETNSSGNTVLTQYYERARLEFHPDQPAASRILGGRLGSEIHGRSDDQPSPSASASADPSGSASATPSSSASASADPSSSASPSPSDDDDDDDASSSASASPSPSDDDDDDDASSSASPSPSDDDDDDDDDRGSPSASPSPSDDHRGRH